MKINFLNFPKILIHSSKVSKDNMSKKSNKFNPDLKMRKDHIMKPKRSLISYRIHLEF